MEVASVMSLVGFVSITLSLARIMAIQPRVQVSVVWRVLRGENCTNSWDMVAGGGDAVARGPRRTEIDNALTLSRDSGETSLEHFPRECP
jgi:hypothetical protein